MSEDNPLEDLYEDRDEIDRERLGEALKGIIGIDQESGDPIFHEQYYDLGNKEQFVALLLYRSAAEELGELDSNNQSESHEYFSQFLEVSGSAVRNYAGDLPFVESSPERGGYIIPDYSIAQAIDYIESE